MAADGGDNSSKLAMAELYRDGLGVPQNYELAAKLYREGAKIEKLAAPYELGVLYRDGRGVPQDIAQALK